MVNYRTVQNFQGTKLSQLGHHVSICGKAFAFASKQCPQVPKHFEIFGKHSWFKQKPRNPQKFWPSDVFVLYGIMVTKPCGYIQI